jgi:hypothetical protein
MLSCARLTAGGLLLVLLALAGCADLGESGVDAEFNRIQGERGVAVVSSSPQRAVFMARGQRIVVEPLASYCLDADAIEVTRRSAFTLITDCLDDRQVEVAQESGSGQAIAINLPRSFPGIMTVSVSGDPALGSEPQALDEFEALLRSDAGRQLLTRGDNGAKGSIVATRRAGRALYVLVDEEGGQSSFLSPRYWRGFIQINERLVLVTVSSFSDRPTAADGMLAFLASQTAQLRRANGMKPDFDEDGIASQLAAFFSASPETGVEVASGDGVAQTEDGIAPTRAPKPQLRDAKPAKSPGKGYVSPIPPPRSARVAYAAPAIASSAATAPVPSGAGAAKSGSASKAAPKVAPLAPKRPR